MGNAASKSPSTRKLPVHNVAKRLRQQAPPSGPASNPPPASPHPKTPASDAKSDAIIKDSQDPHFSSMLRSLGSVSHGNTPQPPSPSSPGIQPPQFSIPPPQKHSATSNGNGNSASTRIASRFSPKIPDSVRILQAREYLYHEMGQNPEDFLDVFKIRDVVMMREGGGMWGKRRMRDDEIERTLRLKPGILSRLGKKVGHRGVQVREKEEVEFVNAVV